MRCSLAVLSGIEPGKRRGIIADPHTRLAQTGLSHLTRAFQVCIAMGDSATEYIPSDLKWPSQAKHGPRGTSMSSFKPGVGPIKPGIGRPGVE